MTLAAGPSRRQPTVRQRAATMAARASACVCLFRLLAGPADAVLFFSTGDPAHNTVEPTGNLAGSGWKLQGQWHAFVGTPIAPNLFITAKHVGGNVDDDFQINGNTHKTLAIFDDPDSDLRICQVCQPFAEFAPLYTKSVEAGKSLIVFGRGSIRGAEIQIPNNSGTELKGWGWSNGSGQLRWGLNQVASVMTFPDGPDLLRAEFNADGGADEAHLAGGDSGGAIFIQDAGVWKLAGVNFGVDGPYNDTDTGAGFSASIFDEGGLHISDEGLWSLQPERPLDRPGAFYGTRISSRLSWINQIVAEHGLGPRPELLSAESLSAAWQVEGTSTLDLQARQFVVPKPSVPTFFQLGHCSSLTVTNIAIDGPNLILDYSP